MIADPSNLHGGGAHEDDGAAAFDALTDLFLGDAEGSPVPKTVRTPAGPATRPAERGAPAGAAPGGFAPRLVGGSTEAKSGGERVPPARRAPQLEALLLGHLPLMAAAWTAQYVRMRAQEADGPTALVRMTGDWVRVELHGAPRGADGRTGAPNLTGAIDVAARSARVVLCASSADESRLLRCGPPDEVTLLTGADEAGVVAAYRTIKGVAGAMAADGCAGAPGVAGCSGAPGFRLAVVGTNRAKAQSVWRRLAEASKAFLGVEMALAGCVERIATGLSARVLYDGPMSESIENLVARLMTVEPVDSDSVAASGSEHDQPLMPDEDDDDELPDVLAVVRPESGCIVSPAPPFADMSAGSPSPDQQAWGPESVCDDAAIGGTPVFEEGPQGTEGLTAGESGASVRSEHATADLDASEVAGDAGSGPPATDDGTVDLCLFVPGLRPIAARCPFAENVQLAVDEHGVLAVLVRAGTHGGSGGVPSARAVEALLAAAAWASLNIRLIALSLGGQRLDQTHRPTLHLFTAEPAATRRLLDSEIRVHILLAVTVKAGFVSAALN